MSLENSQEVLVWKISERNGSNIPATILKAHYLIFYTPRTWMTEYINDLKGSLSLLPDLRIKYIEELKSLVKKIRGQNIYDDVYIVFPPIKEGSHVSMEFLLKELAYLGIEEKSCVFIDSEKYEKLHLNNKNKDEREKVLEKASKTWALKEELGKGNNFYIYVDDITTASSTAKFVIRFLEGKDPKISQKASNAFLKNVCSFTLAKTLKENKYVNISYPKLSKEINAKVDSKLGDVTTLKNIF